VLATIAGMAAIVALPLSLAAPRSVVVTVFATPLLLAVVAKMRDLRWLFSVAFALLVLLGAAITLPVALLSVLAAVVLFVGPIVAVIVVGVALREIDLVAAGSFLLSGTIAVIAGFAGAETDGAAIVVVGVAVVGLALVFSRLNRTSPEA
jgi:hypothetical protein